MNFDFEAIGTHWTIDIPESADTSENQLRAKIFKRIEQFDKNYSRFREDSLISKISRAAGTYQLPEDAQPLLDLYKQLYELSDELFTPLIGKTLEQAGYDKNYSLIPTELTQPPKWEEALEYQFPILKTELPVLLDFGAAGKGYLIDLVSELLKAEGVTSFTIDAGGDILHHGNEINIGLEDPENELQAIGVVKISEGSIAGSSGSRRKWAEFHHIIDPTALKPVEDMIAVWVTSSSAMIADGLATALYLNPQPEKYQQFEYEYLIVFKDRSFKKSNNFSAELFLNN